jgi:hypothetical protein
MGANTTLMTVQQFLELPDETLRRHELWQGELIEVGETIFAHNWIRETLRFGIKQFLLTTNVGGEVRISPTGTRSTSHALIGTTAPWRSFLNCSPRSFLLPIPCARFSETRSFTFERESKRYGS